MASCKRMFRLSLLKVFVVFTALFFVLILLMSFDRDLDARDAAAAFVSRREVVQNKLSGMFQALQNQHLSNKNTSRDEKQPSRADAPPMSDEKISKILSKLIVERDDSPQAPGFKP